MPPHQLQHWLKAGETQTQEFKSSFDKACIETMVAFANAKGGRVLVCVTDRGAIQGTTLGKSEGVIEGANGGVGGGVNTPEALRQIILKTPGLNAASLVERSAKPLRTVERWLKQLKDQGHIEFRGALKTGGYHPVGNP
ncbi:MAG: helix-turn-helix domain-containing protein [Limnohabitans sp.]